MKKFRDHATNLLEILFKILDKHLLPFYVESPRGRGLSLVVSRVSHLRQLQCSIALSLLVRDELQICSRPRRLLAFLKAACMLTNLQNIKLYKNALEYNERLPLACVASVSVGFRGKELPRDKKRGEILALDPISRGQNTVLWSFFTTPRKRLLRRLKAAFHCIPTHFYIT